MNDATRAAGDDAAPTSPPAGHDVAGGPHPPAGFRGVFRADEYARAMYSEGAGIARIIPTAAAVPADADDVVTLVRWAGERGEPLVPRGSGSSRANGAVGPGIVVDLSRLRDLGRVDAESQRVTAGPGVLRDEVELAARARGLTFPVDPSSGAFCTVGGMAACNAAGTRTPRYGAMRGWVHGVECVFADGTRAWVRRGEPAPRPVPAVARFLDEVAPAVRDTYAADPTVLRRAVRKDSSGYALGAWAESGELVDLLVGSEGTLALFTALELRLHPEPLSATTVLMAFATLDAATECAVMLASLGASAVELLDRTFLEVVRRDPGSSAVLARVPADADAVLIVEAEGWVRGESLRLGETLAAEGARRGATAVWTAAGAAEVRALWAFRHAASPTLARLNPELTSMQVIEDGAVPPERFAEYVRGVRSAFDHHGLRGVIFGHAGDAHAHVNALVDLRQPDWRARVEGLLDEVTALVASLGGTLAGEHGDGRLRTPLLHRTWAPPAMELFAATKQAFDPQGILNPGVKVPLAGVRAVGEVKYDRQLPPLPDSARDALAAITRDKGWARLRIGPIAS